MTVEQALIIGADAVSVHINIGDESDSEMLRMLGYVSRQCLKWGMPLVGRAPDLAFIGPGGTEDPFEVEARHHVHHPSVAIVVSKLGVECVIARRQNNCPDLKSILSGF
jgi:NADH pyrophosphatase NudC (nudix superfamily)